MDNLNLSFNLEAFDRKPSDLATIGEGTSYYRLLPPFGTNHRGSPFSSFTLHWGFQNAEGNDTVVTCSYDTEKFCPVCEKVRAAEEEAKRDTTSPDRKAQLEDFVKTFRADRAFYFNAVNQEGRVVKLKLKPMLVTGRRTKNGDASDASITLLSKIKEAVNVFKRDPLSLDSGVWFAFSRSGKGINTTYSVDFKRITTEANGQIVQTVDTTPLVQIFPELYQSLKAQYEFGAAGPAFDIHKMYEPMTAVKLREVIESGVAPSRSRSNQGSAPQVGQLTQPPVAFTPKPEVATEAAPPTVTMPGPAGSGGTNAPAPQPAAPVVTMSGPVASGGTSAPAPQPAAPAPTVSAAEARAKLFAQLQKS